MDNTCPPKPSGGGTGTTQPVNPKPNAPPTTGTGPTTPAKPPPVVPTDMVAVYDQFDQQWWLYYVSTDGLIKYIVGPKNNQPEDTYSEKQYEVKLIPEMTKDSNDIGTTIPKARTGSHAQLAACVYTDKDKQIQRRVYYANQNNELCEMCWSNDKGWYKGSLNSSYYSTHAHTFITTAITENEVKVYYRGPDENNKAKLWAAFSPMAFKSTWSRRPILKFE